MRSKETETADSENNKTCRKKAFDYMREWMSRTTYTQALGKQTSSGEEKTKNEKARTDIMRQTVQHNFQGTNYESVINLARLEKS